MYIIALQAVAVTVYLNSAFCHVDLLTRTAAEQITRHVFADD